MFNVLIVQRRIFCLQSMFRLFNDVLLYTEPDIIDGYPLMMKCLSARNSAKVCELSSVEVVLGSQRAVAYPYFQKTNSIKGYLI
jgi:hypothetical protein